MNPGKRLILLAATAFSLQGCIAKTAVDVVTLPVKVASKGVDLATTSQSEADRNRGREIRQREERLGHLRRDYEKQIKRCQDGDRNACNQARIAYAEIQQLLPTIPAEPADQAQLPSP
jgi:hypothetical protein